MKISHRIRPATVVKVVVVAVAVAAALAAMGTIQWNCHSNI